MGTSSSHFSKVSAENGLTEGKNVKIEYRWAEGRYDRLGELAPDLLKSRVSVIAATGGDASALAMKQATQEIPVVFTIGGDPVELGLVKSFSRPGANLTGLTQYTAALEAKRLEILHQLLPRETAITMLIDPNNPKFHDPGTRSAGSGAHDGRADFHSEGYPATMKSSRRSLSLERQKPGALFVASDPVFNSRRELLVAQVKRLSIPAMFHQREFATAGGLISYGSSATDMYRRAAGYVARILKGDKPADLPVLQPVKFELVINLKTAKTLGIEVTPSLLAAADEVIE